MSCDVEKLSNLKETLDRINAEIRRVTEQLDSADFEPVLTTQLHDPDVLPDEELTKAAGQVVDSMDALQLRLVPSVMLLADGFFGVHAYLC
jgi:gliotoxin/aspirochlorine biosynthesis O-methyltransferase